jgi:hypothetical protein
VTTPVQAAFFAIALGIVFTVRHRFLVVLLVAAAALAGQVVFLNVEADAS